MSNLRRKNIVRPGVSVGRAPQLNVVQVPNILWTVNGKPRKIYLECFDLLDKTCAQKDAMHLSKVMVDRVFGKKYPGADDRPIVRPVDG